LGLGGIACQQQDLRRRIALAPTTDFGREESFVLISPLIETERPAPVEETTGNRLGAHPDLSGRSTFMVWAPYAHTVDVHIVHPEERLEPMIRAEDGHWSATLDRCPPGTRYLYRLNGSTDRPDPASRRQPRGVHGPSEICRPVAPNLGSWRGLPLEEYILYEVHTGTFTREGTLDAIISELPRLSALGITAIELMPIAEFPGDRNWGYDGVYPFAVEHSYGGIDALRRLVQACHELGLAVVLDVVYNHLGPEGNYLGEFGPYFTDRYRTPWGDALNFDGPDSDPVRRYFLENALFWIEDCGIDALRLDAIHAIFDRSASPFLQELASVVHEKAEQSGRKVYLIAESDLNDARIIRSVNEGGFGLDAQWSDDFHHALHTLLTGEVSGYYSDFGELRQLGAAIQDGWAYQGQIFSVSPAALWQRANGDRSSSVHRLLAEP